MIVQIYTLFVWIYIMNRSSIVLKGHPITWITVQLLVAPIFGRIFGWW